VLYHIVPTIVWHLPKAKSKMASGMAFPSFLTQDQSQAKPFANLVFAQVHL
jgi:hypothetical protein